MVKKLLFAAALVLAAVSALRAEIFSHCLYDSISLDGAWEMAYQPYAHEGVVMPDFKGVKVERAIPGYWEDMEKDFRAAGMKDRFRINPWYEKQTFPITNRAGDTTFPDIYGCFFYRRKIVLDRTDAAVLAFEGVRNQVHAWINGKFVDFRAGFSTPFELAVPPNTLVKGENEIVLAVANVPNLGYCDYVYGLTTRSTFLSTGGVNGKLELRFLKSAMADVYVTTAKNLETFTVHVSGKSKFDYEILDGNKILATDSATGDFTLSTRGFDFWSPENPRRYTLRLISSAGEYKQQFGIRRLVADGEKFRLNGKSVYLRGVTEHCYFPHTLHLPRDLEYYRMITRKRKELGFNFVRFHTFVPPVEYLEATDELGMLVHIESPNFVSEPEYAAIIAFARSHPSVVIYCTGNETRIDRLAETYLEDIANMVHARTDSLFSPMSAMRGVEYALMKGKDPTVKQPFNHNAERMARLAKYCDMFTSYQLGVTSYESLNLGSPEILDRWGDAYLGKPRTSHETCIDSSYVDLSLEKMYPPESPIIKAGIFSGLRELLRKRGLLDRADTYFRNSCEWMWRIRKYCFEKLRLADRVAGFDFLGDINTHWHTFGYSVGMMDEFYRLKPGETVENVLRYNSAAVLLSDLGSDFNVVAGSTKKVAISLSNYGEKIASAKLTVQLTGAAGAVWSKTVDLADIPDGKLSRFGEFSVEIPTSVSPADYKLKADLDGGKIKIGNEWEIHAFPAVAQAVTPESLTVFDDKVSEKELSAALTTGKSVVLFGAGPFNALPSTYRIGLAGRCSGNYATVVKNNHPALAGMSCRTFCDWRFRRLMEGGKTVQLEAGVPFDPIIDVASAVKFPIRQSALFEYRVGKGKLLVCSFNFSEGDPAAAWLKSSLLEYAASSRFEPALALTAERLHAVINAPKLTGSANTNRARNLNDPSSAVRAGRYAQP